MKRALIRLEKVLPGGDIAIKLSATSPIDSTFWLALGIAFTLHISIFWIFHIQPFYTEPVFIFTPIHMQAQLPIGDTALLADSSPKTEKELIPSIELPYLEMISLKQRKEEDQILALMALDSFRAIEQPEVRRMASPWPYLTLYSPLKIQVSGSLSQRPLVKQGELAALSKISYPRKENSQNFQVKYAIQIEEETGKIFWTQIIQSSGKEPLDLLIAKTLLTLQFEKTNLKRYENLKGEIEFVITIHETQLENFLEQWQEILMRYGFAE